MKISFDTRMNSPVWQAVAVAIASAIILSGNWLLNFMLPGLSGRLFPWMIATAFMLFFAVMNSLLSIRSDSFVKYWQASMYSYMGLAGTSALLAWQFSGVSIGTAGSYKWLFLVVSVGFMVFLSMVNFMKAIVNYAEKEEWTAPRRKN
ncbi:MAG: hypothetical protein ACK5FV_07715 [Bacteroidota bacterium]|jgi:hypothetical protein